MGTKVVKVCAAHVAPVFLDREATVEKACGLIAEAGRAGAELVVFPEVFVPGYPYWIWTKQTKDGVPFFVELMDNAVVVPGPATDAIGKAAKQAGVFVVMGMTERGGGTLYNTLLYFDNAGRIIGKHRKLVPTMSERVVWGRGDGSDLSVFDTPLGKISGLICWEHTMDLARYALAAEGEQIHCSVWPGISAVTNDPNSEIFDAVAECACRHHAVAAQAFVICVMTPVAQDSIDRLGFAGRPDMMKTGGGWTAVIAPNGQVIAGPHTGAEEKLLMADIDLGQIAFAKFACDSAGHYARPDVFTLLINREKQNITEEMLE
ncbi:MAG: carbon-nitrogen hydrolase family protein [Clostridiales bacterium]|nr:carbon-nitrogen hydrolase family protein [Clostridiales bacterium]